VTAAHIIDGRSRHSVLMELLTDEVGNVMQDIRVTLRNVGHSRGCSRLGAMEGRSVGYSTSLLADSTQPSSNEGDAGRMQV
jgi:hypothetical protein